MGGINILKTISFFIEFQEIISGRNGQVLLVRLQKA